MSKQKKKRKNKWLQRRKKKHKKKKMFTKIEPFPYRMYINILLSGMYTLLILVLLVENL